MMRELVLEHTGRFFVLWLGAVIFGTGLGALALGSGVPVAAVVYSELVLQLGLATAVAFGVPDRFGGAVALGVMMVLPFGAFVTWAEKALSGSPGAASALLALGALIAGGALLRPILLPATAKS
jgi:hypothetical protein